MLRNILKSLVKEPVVLFIDSLELRPHWQLQLLAELIEGDEVPGGCLSPRGCLFSERSRDRLEIELSVVEIMGKNATRDRAWAHFLSLIRRSLHIVFSFSGTV